MKHLNYSSRFYIVVSLLFLSPSVFAQAGFGAVMGFGITNNIPTLSSTALIIMGLLLATLSYRILNKGDKTNHKMMFSIITIGMISFGYGGIKIIDNAYATQPLIELTNATSQVNVIYGNDVQYKNKTGIPTVIKYITPNANVTACWGGVDNFVRDVVVRGAIAQPRCAVGLSLGVDEICYLTCINPIT